MTDEVGREIKEILDKGQPEKESEGDGGAVNITVGDIVNNQGTVVIGGNVNQGRREEDQEGSSDTGHGRRASDRALRQELRLLRQQVRMLKCLLTARGGTFNRRPAAPRHRLTSCGANARFRRNVSNRPAPVSRAVHCPATRATSGPNPHQLTPTHINLDVSYLVTAHTRGLCSAQCAAPGQTAREKGHQCCRW